MLEIRNLHAKIEDKAILKGIELTLKPGEVHAIMGPNGSGKSTLANILAGRDGYEVTDGSILFEGEDLLDKEPDERAHAGLFLAFQYPIEIPGVANSYFLRTGLNAIRAARGEEELDAMDFLSIAREKAKLLDMDEKLFHRAVNAGFSGGEKKRNEIFQMAVLEPRLAILDETDSGLDIDALKIVAQGVTALRSPDRAFLVITHYQRLLNYIVPDHVHVLHDGKIVRSGGKELALELEDQGYAWIEEEAAPGRPVMSTEHHATLHRSMNRERGHDVLTELRERALARFTQLGFPTTKQEDFRFTNLGPVEKSAFALGRPGKNGISNADVRRLGLAPGLVFVDGHYRADLSSALVGVNLASALDRVDLGIDRKASALVELNTAFLEDGACIEIEGEHAEPIHVLFVGTDGTVCHPRNVYHVKRNAKAHVVETYVSLGTGAHWTNAVGLAVVEANAELKHTRLQIENDAAFHTSDVFVRQHRDSRYTSCVVTLGGRLTRNDITASLDDENTVATLNGLVHTRGEQHVDNSTRVEHRKPNCESHELYKCILDDRSSGVFTGYIHVHPDAQKTDAYQSSSSLLLTDDAVMDSQPQLEIYADDVKCSHGSTIGQLDADALFYLRSRGIPRAQAHQMLIRAFAHDVIDRVEVDSACRRVDELLDERLPGDAAA